MFVLIVLCNLLPVFACSLISCRTAANVISMPRPSLYIWSTAMIHALIWAFSRCLFPQTSMILDLLSFLYPIAATALFSPNGRKWRGTATIVGIQAVQLGLAFTIGSIALPIAKELGYASFGLFHDAASFGSAVMYWIRLCLLTPVCYLIQRLMPLLLQSDDLFPMLVQFLPIPVSQAILISVVSRMLSFVHSTGGITISYILAIVLTVAADAAFLAGRIRQEKLLQENVRQISHQLNVQADYYHQLQDSILTVNQVRHDLNNQLQAAYHLLASGENDQVRCQLDQVHRQLQRRVGSRFCSNLMVDAVLQDKAESCREKGISLSVHAEVPARLSIENAHLCSVFSNLLDNSMQGVLESGAAEKAISLEAGMRGSNLIVRCSNPAQESTRHHSTNLLRSHGLGLEILSKIAARYHGYLNAEYQHGWFHTCICLPLSELPKGEPTYVQ